MDRIYHKIIESPHLYDITFFSYQVNSSDISRSYIDLHMEKDGDLRKLRFWAPQDLEIEKGFPYSTGGMFIEDVSSHQLDGINVYVGDFESNYGSVTFWAKRVEQL
ncbi:hypothetical protein [Microbulbifer sp. GL-2]|uniref:hypothetical protein n=1 Tax=Microbulbifer sp. GL-2 TaxID=2591606 RepID=UPI001180D51B|nr:hypothetical protein [Microbulbifer sp. GL-2]